MRNGIVASSEPSTADLFEQHTRKLAQIFHCVKIGRIQSFDVSSRTATVEVVFRRQKWDDGILDYPVLKSVPVVTIQGGKMGAQFPITKGDECLLVFSDNNIDNWFTYGGTSVPFDSRAHEISDAIAIVGLNSLSNPTVLALAADEGGIADATAKVGIKGGKVTVANDTQNLLTIMDTLIDAIVGITTTGGQTLNPASAAAITTIKLQLAALLY